MSRVRRGSGDDNFLSLGSLLFESEQTTGYFLRRAHDFRVGGSGVVIAGFECLVVGDETRGETRGKIDELIDDWRIFAGDTAMREPGNQGMRVVSP